jgi:hypothetical protein
MLPQVEWQFSSKLLKTRNTLQIADSGFQIEQPPALAFHLKSSI